MTLAELYETQVKKLDRHQRLRLAHKILGDLADEAAALRPEKPRSLLELEGLGAEIWQDVDAQTYVNELRDSWSR